MKNLTITRNGIILFRIEGATMSRLTALKNVKKDISKRKLKSIYRIFKTTDDCGNECHITFIGSKRELK